MDTALQRRLDYAIGLLAGLFVAVLSLGYAFFGLQYFLMFLFVLVVVAVIVTAGEFLTADLRQDSADDGY